MHFLLLGATGRTGRHVVSQLLAAGHTVTALVRDASKLTLHPRLTIVFGSPLSQDDIRRAVRESSHILPFATIFTLNTVRESDSPFAAQLPPARFLADSCANVCEVLEQEGCPRIVIMSTAGAGETWQNLPMLSKAFMSWTNVKYALEDHDLLDSEIRQRKVDWTLVRPVQLTYEDEGTSQKDVRTLGSDGKGMRLTDSVGNAGVANFLIKVAVKGLYRREAVVITD